MVLVKPDYRFVLTVPLHPELDRGILRALIRAAGLTVDESCDLLRRTGKLGRRSEHRGRQEP